MNMNDLPTKFSVINTHVPDTNGNPLFYSFTHGLSNLGLKDICVYGMQPESAVTVLNQLAAMQEACILRTDQKYDHLLVGFDLIVKDVPAANSVKRFGPNPAHPMVAREMYQAVYPDEANLFPWEDGFDESKRYLQYKLYE